MGNKILWENVGFACVLDQIRKPGRFARRPIWFPGVCLEYDGNRLTSISGSNRGEATLFSVDLLATDWSIFEEAPAPRAKVTERFTYPDIGYAVTMMVQGKRVRRAGWNGKGMWIELVDKTRCQLRDQTIRETLPWVGMKTADDKFVPWLCSQTDLLATDWELVDIASRPPSPSKDD